MKRVVSLEINGEARDLVAEPHRSLLDALRDAGLTGTKKGCGLGQCGACTVLVDGKRLKSCLSLAALVEGREITTIEGLAQGEQLHPLQAAFIERDAFQWAIARLDRSCRASPASPRATPVRLRRSATG